jgi:hypothetical protein
MFRGPQVNTRIHKNHHLNTFKGVYLQSLELEISNDFYFLI